jgi:hypothetical protein
MAEDAVKVAPHVYKVALENDRVRVLDTRRGYVNRCVNNIRRRPSLSLPQQRFHPRIELRDIRWPRRSDGDNDAGYRNGCARPPKMTLSSVMI